MNFEIDRIDARNITLDQFKDNYLDLEKPVILFNMEIPGEKDWTASKVKSHFLKKKYVEAGWYSYILDKSITPEMVQNCLSLSDYSLRERPMRVFMQPRGHRTFTHYDGNSVHGLNLQVSGEKDWIIFSPETPLNSLPFMYVAMSEEVSELPVGAICTRFKTRKGDLLFVPRYWQHQVDSCSDVNINFNWVFTPRYPSQTKLGRRESEIVFLRRYFPVVNRAFFPEPISNYGGSGEDLIKNYIKGLKTWKVILRLAIELKNYIYLPKFYKGLRKRADLFSSNNFNV